MSTPTADGSDGAAAVAADAVSGTLEPRARTPPPSLEAVPPRRINVTGPAGSGKSTLCTRLAALLGVPHLELDSLYHGPGWVPRADFVPDVAAFMRAAPDGWVVDGNYRACRGVLWAAPAGFGDGEDGSEPGADTVVVLDLPKPLVLFSLLGRTLRRVVTGEELWNGNTESWGNVLSTDPAKSVLAFCYSGFEDHRQRLVDAERDARDGVRFVRLTSRAEVDAFVARVEKIVAAGRGDRGDGAVE